MKRMLVLVGNFSASLFSTSITAERQLEYRYAVACNFIHSDIREHLPTLRWLATECASVVEIGVRDMDSSWGLLKGLSENPHRERSYLGIDIHSPPHETLNLAREISREIGISFRFWEANDMHIDIEPTELLFIDSLHTYCHLTYELEKFSPKITKYIAMHDTSEPWEYRNDNEYYGNYSEYPPPYNCTKQGLWPAVEDFLKRHPEWGLHARFLNNHGFTILKRVTRQ